MTFIDKLLTYLGFCPSKESAQRFKIRNNTITLKQSVVGVGFILIFILLVYASNIYASVFLLGRLIFIGAVLTLFLGIILWKRFKRKSWVIEEYSFNPVPNPEDYYPLNLYMGWLPSVYFPTGPYYLLETFIKDEGLDATEITRKRVFEYSTWAEYQEFTDRVREARKRRPERVEKKDFTVPPEAVRPLNEWITLEHGKRPLWARLFFMFIAVLSVVIFIRLIWAFLTFPY